MKKLIIGFAAIALIAISCKKETDKLKEKYPDNNGLSAKQIIQSNHGWLEDTSYIFFPNNSGYTLNVPKDCDKDDRNYFKPDNFWYKIYNQKCHPNQFDSSLSTYHFNKAEDSITLYFNGNSRVDFKILSVTPDRILLSHLNNLGWTSVTVYKK